MMRFVVIVLLLAWCLADSPPQNPIIGIFTLPDAGDEPRAGMKAYPKQANANHTYIAASYVKFIQMSGAQVVPIFAFNSTAYLDDILSKVNGVLFTGGSQQFDIKNKWTQNADYILKYAIEQNKKGNPYPVWGTCLGFELLAYLTSGYDSKVLSPVRGESGVSNTVNILGKSYLYDNISTDLKYNLQNGQGSVFFNHIYAVSTKYFQSSSYLKEFWRLTTTSTSTYNQDFVSTLQAQAFPIYAVQFHPEKNLYEWKVNAVRSESGAQIAQILSNRFVEVARSNKNRFNSNDDFRSHVIYNYKPQFTNMSFSQIYLFNEVVVNEEKEVNLRIQ